MRRVRYWATGLILLLAAIAVLLYPSISAEAVQNGIELCVSSILPTLFPFLLISNLWMQLGYTQDLEQVLSPLFCRIFHISGEGSSAYVLGVLGGYPVGVQALVQSYQNHRISKKDAEHLLMFCNNAGPAFLLGIVGGGLFHDVRIGLTLWITHITGSLLIGFLFRPDPISVSIPDGGTRNNISFASALVYSIQAAGRTVTQICMTILTFSFLRAYAAHFLPETIPSKILLYTLELAGAIRLLGQSELSPQLLFVLCSCLVGWGGLCVHAQSLSILSQTGLSSKTYFFGKLLHGILCGALSCIVTMHLPFEEPCGNFTLNAIPLTAAFSILLCWVLLLFLKTSYGKRTTHPV